MSILSRRCASIVGIVVSLLGSCLARAECSGEYCWDVHVEQLYAISGTTNFWVKTTGTETALTCTVDSGVYLLVEGDSKQIYALLMSAQLTDRVVTIRIVGGSNPCRVSYVTLDRQ